MSRGITVTLLSGLMLTACLTTGGCGRRRADHTWYDAQGHAVAENWKTDATGKQIPDPHPYDRYGRQWVFGADGVLVPLPPPAGTTVARHPSYWWWGGSGYRSTGSSTSYRSSSSGSSSSSISRGGFGSTGSGVSS